MLPSTNIHKVFGEKATLAQRYPALLTSPHRTHHTTTTILSSHLTTLSPKPTTVLPSKVNTTQLTQSPTAVSPSWQLHLHHRSLSSRSIPTGSGSAAPASPSTKTDYPSLATKGDPGKPTKATWSAESA